MTNYCELDWTECKSSELVTENPNDFEILGVKCKVSPSLSMLIIALNI